MNDDDLIHLLRTLDEPSIAALNPSSVLASVKHRYRRRRVRLFAGATLGAVLLVGIGASLASLHAFDRTRVSGTNAAALSPVAPLTQVADAYMRAAKAGD